MKIIHFFFKLAALGAIAALFVFILLVTIIMAMLGTHNLPI